MNCKVIATPEFINNIKKLKKKYKNIKNDIFDLIIKLEENPTMGTPLGNNSFKIRLKNSNNNKGQSAGYRVITYYLSENLELFLITIYSKSEKDTILDFELKNIISEIGS